MTPSFHLRSRESSALRSSIHKKGKITICKVHHFVCYQRLGEHRFVYKFLYAAYRNLHCVHSCDNKSEKNKKNRQIFLKADKRSFINKIVYKKNLNVATLRRWKHTVGCDIKVFNLKYIWKFKL